MLRIVSWGKRITIKSTIFFNNNLNRLNDIRCKKKLSRIKRKVGKKIVRLKLRKCRFGLKIKWLEKIDLEFLRISSIKINLIKLQSIIIVKILKSFFFKANYWNS